LRKIIVFRVAALGDFVLTSPALKVLREQFPSHHIILLTVATTKSKDNKLVKAYRGPESVSPWLSMAMPHLIDEVVEIEEINLRTIISLSRAFDKENIELGVVMMDICAPWLSRLKKYIFLKILFPRLHFYGWKYPGSLSGDIKKLKEKGFLKHHVHGPLQFINEIPNARKPVHEHELAVDLRVSQAALDVAEKFANQNFPKRSILVGLGPGSIKIHKRWPLANYIELIERLSKMNEMIKFIVFGPPSDRKIAESIQLTLPTKVVSVAGVFSIEQAAALMGRCDIFIGNDGGSVHLADSMGAPVVSITPGIEYPDSIEPWNNRENSIRASVECSPCYNFNFCPKGHNRCMTEIDVTSVYSKVLDVLARGKA